MPKQSHPPRLQRLPSGSHHLLVDNEPYLLRATELNDSSMSSGKYMNEVWPRLVEGSVRLRGLHLGSGSAMKLCSSRIVYLWLETARSDPQQADGEPPERAESTLLPS